MRPSSYYLQVTGWASYSGQSAGVNFSGPPFLLATLLDELTSLVRDSDLTYSVLVFPLQLYARVCMYTSNADRTMIWLLHGITFSL